MAKQDDRQNAFLDKSILDSFRETINSSPIFHSQKGYKERFNIICAFMDRMASAVHYLNEHAAYPKTEEDFVCFMVYAAMLYDGINKLYENFFHKPPTCNGHKEFFAGAMYYNQPFFSEDTCPTDEVFFEYLRAITFAHPYATDNRSRPFMNQGEQHCSPWVIVNSVGNLLFDLPDGVGVRIYSNQQERTIDLTVSFAKLKQFLQLRYTCICNLNQWALDGIDKQNAEWLKIKVDRQQDEVGILRNIKLILESRFQETYHIDVAIEYLTCTLSNATNHAAVEIYQTAIKEVIPRACDDIDALDYDGMEQALSVLWPRPDNMHKRAHYQLEKIFDYLDKRSKVIDPHSNEFWGLQQAYEFYQDFAKKWVVIDVKTMEYDEIRLLVSTACFLEKQEQDREKGV